VKGLRRRRKGSWQAEEEGSLEGNSPTSFEEHGPAAKRIKRKGSKGGGAGRKRKLPKAS